MRPLTAGPIQFESLAEPADSILIRLGASLVDQRDVSFSSQAADLVDSGLAVGGWVGSGGMDDDDCLQVLQLVDEFGEGFGEVGFGRQGGRSDDQVDDIGMEPSQLPFEVFEDCFDGRAGDQRIDDHIEWSAVGGSQFGCELVGEGGFGWPVAAEDPCGRSRSVDQLPDRRQSILRQWTGTIGTVWLLVFGTVCFQPNAIIVRVGSRSVGVCGRVSVGVLSDWVCDQFGHGCSDRFAGLNAWDVVGGVLVGAVRFEFTLRGIS